MRTWKIDGPPEMVEGMVMKVITSCSLRPANRARKPPIACIPSWEFPAIRITASLTRSTFGEPPLAGVGYVGLLLTISEVPNSPCFLKFPPAEKNPLLLVIAPHVVPPQHTLL